MSSAWDSSVLKKLKALLGKGLSTAEIGKRLGISKNAVVGKLHRLGWNVTATDSAKSKTGAKSASVAATKKSIKPVKKGTTTKVAVKTSKVATKSGKTTTPKAKALPKKVVKTEKNAVKKPAIAKVEKVVMPRGAKATAVHQRIVQHSLEMANLKPNQCRWPIGDPDSENFHFCGRPVFVGKPYCYEHCRQAYQFTAPKKK